MHLVLRTSLLRASPRLYLSPLSPGITHNQVRYQGKSALRRKQTPHVLIDIEEDPYSYLRSIMDPARKQPRHAQKRGSPRNTPETRTSKTMSWILRHGALQEGVPMRGDGFVLVTDLVRLLVLSSSHKRVIGGERGNMTDAILDS